MAKVESSPAYLWYPKDALASGRIDELTAAEECWYRRALDRSWDEGGIPADPVKCAARIGKKCTVRAAAMILAEFFEPHRKDPTLMVNPRQEKERKLFEKKRKQKSDAGKRGMANRWKQEASGYNSVITENNISIPISIPISSIDLKRLIDACARERPAIDNRIVEIGVIQTLLSRNGSTDPINSLAYFAPEINRLCSKAGQISKATIDVVLERRRKQIESSTHLIAGEARQGAQV